MKEKPKVKKVGKNVVKKKKGGTRCVCCGSRREEFEREVERIVFETMKRLALMMKSKSERETFIALLEGGCNRLLEIDKRPETVNPNRA